MRVFFIKNQRYAVSVHFLLLARRRASNILLAGFCCLSSSVTLLAGGPGAWVVGRPTLHGGPVRIRPIRATSCFICYGYHRRRQRWVLRVLGPRILGQAFVKDGIRIQETLRIVKCYAVV